MDVPEALAFVAENHMAVLATRRRDGAPQMSLVTAGVDDDGKVVVSTRETAVKTKNVRRDPRVSVLVLAADFGNWVQLDGTAGVMALPEAMEEQRRVLLRITVERAGPDVAG